MINLDAMMSVANENELALHEHLDHGVMMMEFPAICQVSPFLVSADEGDTWCPEVLGPEGKMWSGRISLRGVALETEIRDMYRELDLGSPDIMLKAARELLAMNDANLFS
jgi:hypothetical protein